MRGKKKKWKCVRIAVRLEKDRFLFLLTLPIGRSRVDRTKDMHRIYHRLSAFKIGKLNMLLKPYQATANECVVNWACITSSSSVDYVFYIVSIVSNALANGKSHVNKNLKEWKLFIIEERLEFVIAAAVVCCCCCRRWWWVIIVIVANDACNAHNARNTYNVEIRVEVIGKVNIFYWGKEEFLWCGKELLCSVCSCNLWRFFYVKVN